MTGIKQDDLIILVMALLLMTHMVDTTLMDWWYHRHFFHHCCRCQFCLSSGHDYIFELVIFLLDSGRLWYRCCNSRRYTYCHQYTNKDQYSLEDSHPNLSDNWYLIDGAENAWLWLMS
jgi:hypothetical protein